MPRRFAPALPTEADLPTIRRALDAATAERHLLAERLFRSIGDRGLHADLHRKLAAKCAFAREMVGFWERRDVGKQAVSNENGSLVVQQDMLLEAPIKHIAAILAEIDLATEWAPLRTPVNNIE